MVVAVGAACAVFLIVLFLTLNVAPAPRGTLTHTLLQFSGEGRGADGELWFGWSEENLSGTSNGYPYAYTPSGTFTISISLVNSDTADHTFYGVGVSSPFRLAGTVPGTPFTVGALEDLLLTIDIGAPASAGTDALVITLNVGA